MPTAARTGAYPNSLIRTIDKEGTTMTTTEEFRPRVRKGIAALEAYEPGATDRISLDTLDLYSLTHCASAQSVGNGDFGRGQERLGIEANDNAAAAYGFAIRYDERGNHTENYAALRQAWITELTDHRTAKADA